MNDKTTDFGIKCREKRENLKLTMAQAAEKTGYAQSTVTKIEQGGQPPSFSYIKKLIDIFEIKNKNDQMEFILSSLKSSKKIDIPLNKLEPIRKKWLAAFCILGDVYTNNPEGWNELLKWLKDFTSELEKINPPCVIIGEPVPL